MHWFSASRGGGLAGSIFVEMVDQPAHGNAGDLVFHAFFLDDQIIGILGLDFGIEQAYQLAFLRTPPVRLARLIKTRR
jgi:hypothetical protein